MELQIDAQRLLHYDLWANQQTLASLRPNGAPKRALEVFAHIAAAHRLFLARVCQDRTPLEVWPPLNIQTVEKELEELRQRWAEVLTDRDACEEIWYTNSQGQHWKNQIKDIILHLAMHSAYHRGQIAMLLGQVDMKPAYTDFIQAARTGVV